MRVSVKSDITTRVITLDVSDAPDVDVSRSRSVPRSLRPDRISIQLKGDNLELVNISGLLTRKSGEPGLIRSSKTWLPQEIDSVYSFKNAPHWIRAICDEVLGKERITVTKKTKHLGYQTGGSSDKYMSPQKPYTGNGKTRRNIFDKVVAVFKTGKDK